MRGARRSGVDPSPSETTGCVGSRAGRRGSGRSAAMPRSRIVSCPAELGDAAVRDDREERRRRVDVGQLRDLGERGLDRALRRLVEDDVQRGADRPAGTWTSRADRDVVRREPPRHVGEHAGPVVDLEVDVERRAQLARRQRSSVAPARVVLEEAVGRRADDLTMSATTADAVSMPPAPGPRA